MPWPAALALMGSCLIWVASSIPIASRPNGPAREHKGGNSGGNEQQRLQEHYDRQERRQTECPSSNSWSLDPRMPWNQPC